MLRKYDHRERPEWRWPVGRCVWMLLLLLALIPLGACGAFDEVLEAELPGRVTDAALDDPELAETLVAGAQANFECGLQGHILGIDAGWALQFQYVIFQIEMIRIANRNDRVRENVRGECQSNRDPIWFIMHRGLRQAADAAERIEAMPEGSVTARDFLLAKAYAYEGYATEILSEAWCEMVFDGNEQVVARQDALQRAEDRFTTSLDHAQQALSGPRAEEAQEIMDLALVGRARSHLNQGETGLALTDAQGVTQGFMYYATYDDSPSRRNNMVERLQDGFVVHPDFRSMTVQGVDDPRVPTQLLAELHPSGVDWWVQTKYPEPGSDIPFASWREAQLMIAEIEGGPTAVGIINDLRDTISDLPWVDDAHPGLPNFSSTDDDEILNQVYEERYRELFLQGVKIGDDLRSGNYEDWDTGLTPVGAPYGDNTCIPLPEDEFI